MFERKCKITFIRHGATFNSEENRLFDDENYPPLNDNGKKEAEVIADFTKRKGLKVDRIYTSSALRTIQTARIISKACNTDFDIIDTLQSRKTGIWSGLTFDQIEKKYPSMLEEYHKDPEHFWPEGGESTKEVNLRVKKALGEIIENNIGNRLIIVTHAEIIQAAIANSLELPIKNQFKVHIPTGSATQISYYRDWASLVYSGYVPI